MQVAFLLQDTATLYGAERATLDLLCGLKRTGDLNVSAVLIYESRPKNQKWALREALVRAGISTTCLETHRRFSWQLVSKIREHVIRQGINCLHVTGYKVAVHGSLAVRFGRVCPWVSTVHGWLQRPILRERFYGWLETTMIKRAQRVVVLSEYYRRSLIRKRFRPEQLMYIPSGLLLGDLQIDPDGRPFASPNRVPTIGILARLSWEKNHGMFLRVARELLDKRVEARFLVAGDGHQQAEIEGEIWRLRLESAVELAGVMDRDAFFRRIDLLALCSRIENLPYAILEAMAWSRPVVATDVGGVSDLVEPGSNGLLVASDDTHAMAEAIGGLLADPARARAMGVAGRERLEERFTLRRSVEAHLKMYQELTQEK